MRHLFIINPVAGGRKSCPAEIEREIRHAASELSEPYEIYLTKAPRDACAKITETASECDSLRVYACGGDGTLNECANGAAGLPHVAITHYPCGTGNDFIKMFGKTDANKFRSVAALIHGVVRPIDLIECNGRYGINICSVGIDARIGVDVHKYSGMPIIGGATGYVVSLAVNVVKGVKQTLSITTDDRTFDGEFSLVCACNGRFYGGGFNPVPDARPDDGVLDFLIVSGVSRLKLVQVVGKYAKGRFRELGSLVTHIRGQAMEIEGENTFVVNIDGESIFSNKVYFKVIPQGINFIFPADMGFFGSNTAKIEAIERK